MTLRACSESMLAKTSSGKFTTGLWQHGRQSRIRNEIATVLGIIHKEVIFVSIVYTVTITHWG
jgi:hypothetical protein